MAKAAVNKTENVGTSINVTGLPEDKFIDISGKDCPELSSDQWNTLWNHVEALQKELGILVKVSYFHINGNLNN